jgi:hypothetical protein
LVESKTTNKFYPFWNSEAGRSLVPPISQVFDLEAIFDLLKSVLAFQHRGLPSPIEKLKNFIPIAIYIVGIKRLI